ncbi:MAG: DUF1800 domain-containing protein [Gemmatimonadaceae bacterium]|nr:DUF1800 domain-containing protein [Gemmatimonadaceae bacterium]
MRRLAPSIVLAIAACSSASPRASIPVPERVAVDAFSTALRTQTADQQVLHALSRLTFGPRPDDEARVRAIGVDRWIEEQLHPERLDDARADQWTGEFEVVQKTAAQLESEYQNPGALVNQLGARARGGLTREDSALLRQARQNLRRIAEETQVSRVGRALLSDRQLQEVMTDFWLNHFSVFAGKGIREQYYLADYENRVIRPRALGKFRDLLGAVAQSPAMLFYLDNWESAADSGRPRLVDLNAPAARRAVARRFPAAANPQSPVAQQVQRRLRAGLNENYGRELLELHTLGVDGGYTQQDVINAARALTGWTIAGPRQGGGFTFTPFMHDAGEKRVLGHTLKGGRGIEDGEELLDIVARHPSTARHIAFKLARRFVSDTPSEALVSRAAATFQRTDGDIREVVRTIVTSPEFFSREAYRAKVKSPFEVVLSTLRALDAQPDRSPRTAQVIASLGQPVYGRQTPDGWPDTADGWLGTGAILNRINFGLAVAAGRLPGATPLAIPGADALRQASREVQVDAVVHALLGGDVSPVTRSVLLTGRNPLLDAATPDASSQMQPEPMTARPQRGLAQIVGLALGSPEFQRR